ncbi:MAG: hypothetical protein ACOXZ0_05375 [Eubacteriales bacterium]
MISNGRLAEGGGWGGSGGSNRQKGKKEERIAGNQISFEGDIKGWAG